MAQCKECQNFFSDENQPAFGDCIRRTVDPRQAYFASKRMEAARAVNDCPNFSNKK
ncbi:MAG: benzylsuccinate synthase gamma subunit family protein [Desulfatibacillaceae bacterium]|nr:benzylsuccinate synthase gamma subunit family protein [Desulfatibacillaceae bacterium]